MKTIRVGKACIEAFVISATAKQNPDHDWEDALAIAELLICVVSSNTYKKVQYICKEWNNKNNLLNFREFVKTLKEPTEKEE